MSKTILQEDMEQIFSSNIKWDFLINKTVLITGANGFLPAYMVDFLMFLNKNYFKNTKCRVIALVRNFEHSQQRFENYLIESEFSLLHQDVSEEIAIKEKIDYIIHAASPASPKYYSSDPVGVSLPNILGTKNILELARKNNIESLLYFSSGEVYGDTKNLHIKETDYGYLDPLDLRSCYAESKRMGESLCRSYFHQYKVPCKIIRPFHTYGPGMKLDDGRVFADFVKNIVKNEDIVLKSEGTAERAFCYLADAVEGFFKVLLYGLNGEAYNVANSEASISIKNLAELVVTLAPNKELSVKYNFVKNDKYMKSQIEKVLPDTSKLEALGWMPKTSLAEGFKKTIRSYNDN